MSLAADLLATASLLIEPGPRRPKQTDLRRAVSTAYCALFHAIATDAADLLHGTRTRGSADDWKKIYRALDHGFAKNACGQCKNLGFGPRIMLVADTFVVLQQARHTADYDPLARLTKADARTRLTEARTAIGVLNACERDERRRFAIHVLFKERP